VAVSYQARERERGIRHTATVRRGGHTISATFFQQKQAQLWARRCEESIDAAAAAGRTWNRAEWIHRGRDPTGPAARADLAELDRRADPDKGATPRADWTLRRALAHYSETVAAKHNGAAQECARLAAWQRDPLAARRLAALTAADLAAWVAGRTVRRRRRLADGKHELVTLPAAASTIRNDIYRIAALYSHARAATTRGGWGLTGLPDPVDGVALPALPHGRQRRLDGDEGARVLAELATGPDGAAMVALAVLALETGMRRSELLDLRAGQVRRTRLGQVIERGDSKSGAPRRVVLTDRAEEVLAPLTAGRKADDRLIRLSADAAAWRWRQARTRAGCPDLRMHDLRHEALSSMADAGLSVGALASQSGHRTAQTLLRYVQASEADIRQKMAARK